MGRLDSVRVEQLAVIAVKNVFDNTPRILSSIRESDRDPCIDGVLRVYESEDLRKENLKGEISVQVKGTSKKLKTKDHTKYSVEVTDLKKYKNVYRGILYFVVHVGIGKEPKIFYKSYLPYEIDEALSRLKHDGQQTLTERFKPLPVDERLLQRLCDEFISDRDKQLTDSLIGFKSLEEWRSQDVVFEKLVLSKQFMSPDELLQLDVWSNGGYWYGLTKDGVYHLVEKVDDILQIEMGAIHIIHAGDYSDTYEVRIGQDYEGDFIAFGGFVARLGPNPYFKLNFTGDFRSLLKDALLARAIAIHESFWIEGGPTFQNTRFNALTLAEMDERIASLEKVVHLLDALAIKVKLDPADMSDYELGELGRLGASLIDGEEVPLSATEDELVNLNVEFEKGRIKIIAVRSSTGNYRFCDPLATGYVCALTDRPIDETGAIAPLPTFFLLNREDFGRAMNLDEQRLLQALDEAPIVEDNSAAACNKLLDMLDAYDGGAICESNLLKCCLVVAERLLQIDKASEVYRINYAQVLKRMGSLPENIEGDLRDIALHSERLSAKASAYILLGDRDMAVKCLQDLSEAEQREFKNWPIANLGDTRELKRCLPEMAAHER